MDELAGFRELLRSRMRARGAQARLSEISGIPSPVLGRWRDGEGRPTDTNLRKLAPALGESYERLAKMCGYLPAEATVPEVDLIEQAIRQRTAEMREAVRGTPRSMWATIIRKTFDRAIDGARDIAELLSAEDSTQGTSADEDQNGRGIDAPRRRQRPIKPREATFALAMLAK